MLFLVFCVVVSCFVVLFHWSVVFYSMLPGILSLLECCNHSYVVISMLQCPYVSMESHLLFCFEGVDRTTTVVICVLTFDEVGFYFDEKK